MHRADSTAAVNHLRRAGRYASARSLRSLEWEIRRNLRTEIERVQEDSGACRRQIDIAPRFERGDPDCKALWREAPTASCRQRELIIDPGYPPLMNYGELADGLRANGKNVTPRPKS
jgi:hypothetical protein